jgi:hypothetical protein
MAIVGGGFGTIGFVVVAVDVMLPLWSFMMSARARDARDVAYRSEVLKVTLESWIQVCMYSASINS